MERNEHKKMMYKVLYVYNISQSNDNFVNEPLNISAK